MSAKHLVATRTKENSSQVCVSAFVLAALSIEILLKSLIIDRKFTLKESLNENGLTEFTIENEKVKFKGHLFEDLYKNIKENTVRGQLLAELGCSEEELLTRLKRYQDYYTKARYTYESDSLKTTNSGIITLASDIESAIQRIGNISEQRGLR